MSHSTDPDIFKRTILLDGAVQRITIETGLYNEEAPYYKASMPDGRVLFLELDSEKLLWRLTSGEITAETEAIGDLIMERYS